MGFYRHHFVSDPARGAANARRWENGGSLRREQALHYQSPICTIWNDATGANGTRITRAANQHHAKQDERAAKNCRICFKTRRYVEPARKKVRQRRRVEGSNQIPFPLARSQALFRNKLICNNCGQGITAQQDTPHQSKQKYCWQRHFKIRYYR
jgi:hypothetical protein